MRLPWWLPFGTVPELSAQELARRLPGLELDPGRPVARQLAGGMLAWRSAGLPEVLRAEPSPGG